MKSITTLSGIFEGRADALTFTHSVRLLTDNLYRTVGRWTAMSLTQGGPGPQCIAEAVYHYWTGLPVGEEHLSIDLVVDVDMRRHIQQVCDKCNAHRRYCQFFSCFNVLSLLVSADLSYCTEKFHTPLRFVP